jgi:hypothetical protein
MFLEVVFIDSYNLQFVLYLCKDSVKETVTRWRMIIANINAPEFAYLEQFLI